MPIKLEGQSRGKSWGFDYTCKRYLGQGVPALLAAIAESEKGCKVVVNLTPQDALEAFKQEEVQTTFGQPQMRLLAEIAGVRGS